MFLNVSRRIFCSHLVLHLFVPFKLNNNYILSLAKTPNQLIIINFSRVLYGNLTGESLEFSPYSNIIEVDNAID